MNDWSNDELQLGDLVIVHGQPPGYMRDMLESQGMGIVISLSRPPQGSLQTYDVTVLTPKGRVDTYRQYLEMLK
jgi:hypothetical protein